MKRILPGVLLAVGIAAGFWGWRSMTEEGRRYSAILDRIRAHQGKTGGEWSAGDADAFWNHVTWFRDHDPSRLGRKIAESILDGDEAAEAIVLAIGILGYEGFVRTDFRDPGRILPPPEGAVFRSAPFAIGESILGNDDAVDRLAGGSRTADRYLLLMLIDRFPTGYEACRRALNRLAERDPDLGVRIEAIGMFRRLNWLETPALLARIAEDPQPAARLAALSVLCQGGDAQSGRELLLLVLQRGHEIPTRHKAGPIRDASNSLRSGGALGSELGVFAMESELRSPAEIWELAERLGAVLERRAVGDYGEPLNE